MSTVASPETTLASWIPCANPPAWLTFLARRRAARADTAVQVPSATVPADDPAWVEEAGWLLLNPHYAIHDIAEHLGFPTPGTFCRAFEQRTGSSPAAWRGHLPELTLSTERGGVEARTQCLAHVEAADNPGLAATGRGQNSRATDFPISPSHRHCP